MFARILLYTLAVLACLVLLSPYPATLFVAGCLSCVTLPLYSRLAARLPGVRAVWAYAGLLVAGILVPVSILVLLVLPQVNAGIRMFRQLRDSGFQLPPVWLEKWRTVQDKLADIPGLGKIAEDLQEQVDSLMSSNVSSVISGGVGLLDRTVSALWLLFLCLTLTCLFTVYAPRLRHLTLQLFRMPEDMLDRFVQAVRGALHGVFLGVVLVAMAQGALCGVGFAVAGVKQPAFWGLLAALVAPIPVVGTALVWLPLCVVLWVTDAVGAAVGLCLWGMLAVSGADSILRPLFLRSSIQAPVVVLVLAILCGMAALGTVGLIAGPVLVAFAIQATREGDRLLHEAGEAPCCGEEGSAGGGSEAQARVQGRQGA